MQPAMFIAGLIGPAFVVAGAGVPADGPFYTALIPEAAYSPTLVYFSGLMALVPGLAIQATAPTNKRMIGMTA